MKTKYGHIVLGIVTGAVIACCIGNDISLNNFFKNTQRVWEMKQKNEEEYLKKEVPSRNALHVPVVYEAIQDSDMVQELEIPSK